MGEAGDEFTECEQGRPSVHEMSTLSGSPNGKCSANTSWGLVAHHGEAKGPKGGGRVERGGARGGSRFSKHIVKGNPGTKG